MQEINFGNKWFEMSIKHGSPDFPGGIPSLKNHMIKMSPRGYIGKKVLDLRSKYSKTDADLLAAVSTYKEKITKLIGLYDSYMTEYDREILATTCANGIWKGAHTDLDATGGPGAFNDFEIPNDVIAAVTDYYNKVTPIRPEDISTSMVRGKNTGWPHPISGIQRELNLGLYSVHASIAALASSSKSSLKEVISQLERYHGPAFAIYGERTQHTAKTMPMILQSGILYTKNFEPRKRGILMVPKFVVMRNRVGVQHAKHKILNSHIHNQSRPNLVKDIPAACSNYKVKAVDWPKFDFTFGGRAGRSVLRIIAGISDNKLMMEDLLLEFEMPLLYFGYHGAYMDKSAPQLPSGASFTSLMGCTANFSTVVWALSKVKSISPSEVIASLDKTWFLRCWGDDTIIGLKESWCTHETLFKAMNDIIKKEMDVEPVIKYLGDVYAGDEIKDVNKGYQLSRWVQQEYFPERIKDYPFAVIGHIARLSKLDSSLHKEIHNQSLKIWDPKVLGEPFHWSDHGIIMDKAVKDVEKYAAKISQIDDILQFMTHGNEDAFITEEDADSEFIHKLLGVVSVDISDPIKMLEDHSKYRNLRLALDRFNQMGFAAYSDILTALRSDFNLKYAKGDLLY